MSAISCSCTDVFEEKVSKGKLLILAFQHVLTMCPASIAVPLILGSALNLDNKTITFLVSANFFTSGISILFKVDFFTGGNFTIVGISLAVVVGVTVVPNIFEKFPSLLSMLLSNGLFMVSITAIILNTVFNFNDIKKSFIVNEKN